MKFALKASLLFLLVLATPALIEGKELKQRPPSVDPTKGPKPPVAAPTDAPKGEKPPSVDPTDAPKPPSVAPNSTDVPEVVCNTIKKDKECKAQDECIWLGKAKKDKCRNKGTPVPGTPPPSADEPANSAQACLACIQKTTVLLGNIPVNCAKDKDSAKCVCSALKNVSPKVCDGACKDIKVVANALSQFKENLVQTVTAACAAAPPSVDPTKPPKPPSVDPTKPPKTCDRKTGPKTGSCPEAKCAAPPKGCKFETVFEERANKSCCPKLCYSVDKNGEQCTSPADPTPGPTKCCKALSAFCLAQCAGMTEEEYCAKRPQTNGCPKTPVDPTPGPSKPKFCCMAMTAKCLSCKAGLTLAEYCEGNPRKIGCNAVINVGKCCKEVKLAKCAACVAQTTVEMWCEKHSGFLDCPRTRPPTPAATGKYNCNTRELWSDEKRLWCCINERKGCPTDCRVFAAEEGCTSDKGKALKCAWNADAKRCERETVCASKRCEAEAACLKAVVKKGGKTIKKTKEECGQEVTEAARGELCDTLAGCLEKALAADEPEDAADACFDSAKEVFKNNGGTSDGYDIALDKCRNVKVCGALNKCPKKNGIAQLDKCGASIQAAFVSVGGSKEGWREAVAACQRTKNTGTVETCVKGAVLLLAPGASDKDKAKAAGKCWEKTRAAAGGSDAKDGKVFEQIVKFAREKAAEALRICISNKRADYELAVGKPLAKQMQAACEKLAKEAYILAGGDPETYLRELRAGAEDQRATTLSLCFDGQLRKWVAKNKGKTPSDKDKRVFKAACDAAERKANADAGRTDDGWEQEKKEAATRRAKDALRACVDQKNGNGPPASGTNLIKFVKECEANARDEYEKSGGDNDDYERQKWAGARGAVTSVIENCVKNKIDALDLADDEEPTKLQVAGFVAGCTAAAVKEHALSGGDPDQFERDQARGAREKAADLIRQCVADQIANTPEGDEVTAEDKRAFLLECEARGKDAHRRAGGNADEWEREKQRGAREKAAEGFEACVKGLVKKLEAESDRIPTPKEYTGFVNTCKAAAKKRFEESGGASEDYERERARGAREVATALGTACVKKQIDEELDGDKPSKEQLKTFVKKCDDKARDALKNAGGKVEDWAREKLRGARAGAAELLEACARNAKSAAAKKLCEAKARDFHRNAGGHEDEFPREKTKGARENAATLMEACVREQIVELDLAAGDKPDEKLVRLFVLNCEDKAKAALANSGGDPALWAREKRRGAKEGATELLKACVVEKLGDVAVGDATKDQLKAATKACLEKARDAHNAGGGDDEEFSGDVQDGAEEDAGAVGSACVRAEKDANPDATAKQIAGYLKECGKKARDAYKAAGGDDDEWGRAQERGAKAAAASLMESCVRDKAAAATETVTTKMRLGFKIACAKAARDELERAGGDASEAAAALRDGARKRAADFLGGCVKDTLIAKGFDQDAPPTKADIKEARLACTEVARESNRDAGGDDDEFERTKRHGAREKLGEIMSVCTREYMANNPKATKAAALTTCARRAREIHREFGGDDDEEVFEREKRRAAAERAQEVFKGCVRRETLANVEDGEKPTPADVKAAVKTCQAKFKEAFGNSGGDDDAVDREMLKAAGERAGRIVRACMRAFKDNRTDTEEKPTPKEVAQALKECAGKAKAVFLESGGTEEKWDQFRTLGARLQIGSFMESCVRGNMDKEGTDGEDVDSASFDASVDKSLKKCWHTALRVYTNAGGALKDFFRQAAYIAKERAADFFESCRSAKSDAKETDEAKVKRCKKLARGVYKLLGGDKKEQEVSSQDGVVSRVADELEACVQAVRYNRATFKRDGKCKPKPGQAPAVQSCICRARAIAEKLGLGDRVNKVLREARRLRNAAMLEVCKRKAIAENDVEGSESEDEKKAKAAAFKACVEAAKAEWKASGGQDDDEEEEDERRRGGGKRAGETWKACIKAHKATGNFTRGECREQAKDTHEDAGGKPGDAWFDRRDGLFQHVGKFFGDCMNTNKCGGPDTAKRGECMDGCVDEAKTYWTDALDADAEDFSSKEVRRGFTWLLKASKRVATKYVLGKINLKNADFSKVKKAVEKIRNAIEEVARTRIKGAVVVEIGDGDDESFGDVGDHGDGEVSITFQIDTDSEEDAAELEGAIGAGGALSDNLGAAVTLVVNAGTTRRALKGSGRGLDSGDAGVLEPPSASQGMEEVGAGADSPDTDAPDTDPTTPPQGSGSGGSAVVPGAVMMAFSVLSTCLALLLTF